MDTQDSGEHNASGELTLHESELRMLRECAELNLWDDLYKKYGTNERRIGSEFIGCGWSHELLLTCVQLKFGSPK